ncbi:hypothetical protein ATY79_28920 [Rhizobium sp. R693]|nr:hypothetical protein ATY79_28920 [Rhizobium sp. R693]
MNDGVRKHVRKPVAAEEQRFPISKRLLSANVRKDATRCKTTAQRLRYLMTAPCLAELFGHVIDCDFDQLPVTSTVFAGKVAGRKPIAEDMAKQDRKRAPASQAIKKMLPLQ